MTKKELNIVYIGTINWVTTVFVLLVNTDITSLLLCPQPGPCRRESQITVSATLPIYCYIDESFTTKTNS